MQPLKEVVIKVEDQRVVTEDGGTINLDTVIYMQVYQVSELGLCASVCFFADSLRASFFFC